MQNVFSFFFICSLLLISTIQKKYGKYNIQAQQKLEVLNSMRFLEQTQNKDQSSKSVQKEIIEKEKLKTPTSSQQNIQQMLKQQGIDAIDLRQSQDPFENHLFQTGTPKITNFEHQYISNVPDDEKLKLKKRQEDKESMQIPSYSMKFFS